MGPQTANKWGWHIHHMTLVERFSGGGIEERGRYINTEKPPRERARRLRLMKVVQAQDFMEALQQAISFRPDGLKIRRAARLAIPRAINLLHTHECKKCPWNGLTIFPKKKKVKK